MFNEECSTCAKILALPLIRPSDDKLHWSVWLCILPLGSATLLRDGVYPHESQMHFALRTFAVDIEGNGEFYKMWSDKSHLRRVRVATVDGDIAAHLTNLPVLRPLGSSTASVESYECARRWIQNCISFTQSPYRLPPISPALVPLRLVEVGQSVTLGGHNALRLRDTSDLQEAQYATLSYSWGKGSAQWKTQHANLARRQSSMTDIVLPATLRNATAIAHELGVGYLWIDSLCIVQDDTQEWTSEAAKMGDIYKHGLFNIAANIGEDCHTGCFNTRSASRLTSYQKRCILPSRLENGQTSRLLLYEDNDLAEDQRIQEFTNGPLAQRAWVCQERLLSPRILYYSKSQLFWECQHCVLAEDGLPVGGPREDDARLLRNLLRNEKSLLKERNWERLWYESLVKQQYSRGMLTRGSDKLIALSGLARAFSSYKRSSYMAGLWEDSLVYGLQWYRIHSTGSKSQTNRAPSWSWASQDGPVEYMWDSYSKDIVKQFGVIALGM